MTFGSLFSGIGGIDLGLTHAGMECRWQVEIDRRCQQVLERHWPGIPRFPDATWVGRTNLKYVDLICGGFPCQDISLAGKGEGLGGSRSGLWRQFARIIRELRPKYVLVENVPALLGRGMGIVLGDLAEAGYDAEWEVLSACAFGAPHTRERLFILAYPQSVQSGSGLRSGGETGEEPSNRRILTDRSSCIDYWQMDAIARRVDTCPACGEDWCKWHERHREDCGCPDPWDESDDPGFNWWATEPSVARVAYGIPDRVDRVKELGNAVVPQVAEYIGHQILAWDRGL